MTAVGQWLKEIILIVILAVMTDLLLPTKAMQRYVRMVMGLAIIAVMLQPMMPYFRRDWADQVAAYAVSQLGGESPQGSSQGLANSAGPSGASQTVDQSAIQQAFDTAQTQRANELVAEEIRSQLQQQYHVKANRVQVQNVGPNTSTISVQIELSRKNASFRKLIQNGIAAALGVQDTQIEVTVGGGDTSGF